MAPNFTQILKSFEGENNLNQFEEKLTNFNSTLHPVRTKIDDFFKERNMFSDWQKYLFKISLIIIKAIYTNDK